MKSLLTLPALIVTVASVFSISKIQAATWLVDFNSTNDGSASKLPDAAGNHWNTLTGTNDNASSYSSALIDIANTMTGATIEIASYTGPFSASDVGWAGAGANSGDTGISVGGSAPLLNQPFAYRDGIYSSDPTTGLNLTFSGLIANTAYDFAIYGGRSDNGSNGIITNNFGGFTLTGDTLIENRTVAEFSVISDATGVIRFRWADESVFSQDSALLNAMSITQQVPEPSIAVLGGFGLLALLNRRRR